MKVRFLGIVASIVPLAWGLQTQGAHSSPDPGSVRKLFAARCVSCHGPDSAAGGLDLSSDKGILKGGASGALFVAGKSKESILLHRLRGDDGKPRMPKGFAPLTDAEITLVADWIDAGAHLAPAKKHWAYVAPLRPDLPRVRNAKWCKNPIDYFVLAKLEKEGLKPSLRASRESLIRRVSLDLIGLPPTPAEVAAFANDKSPNAYEKVVDRLLASKHYGERQARMWLDLARYGDSNGYEADHERSMWPYRDWVINAFNSNLPYDRFTIEQIAGDLLPHATLSQRVATGFNRNVMYNEEGGVDRKEQTWLQRVDMVGTTAETWLGTTLNCAQCHNHKYDPFTQRDYYRFLAYFETGDPLDLELRPELAKQRAEIRAMIAHEQELVNKKDPKADNAKLEQAEKKLEPLEGPWTIVFKEDTARKTQTNMRIKGGFLNVGELVSAGTPASLPSVDGTQSRLGLARWLASPKNPLTARVQANRMWEALFGRGIVETSENFGTQGSPPTHPELLDWLATEFVRCGWDMKAINKLIVMSATYQQSSAVTPDRLAKDPRNLWLSHGPRYRLEAEMVRDNALAIAGLLDERIGGPSVFPDQPSGIWDSPYSGEQWRDSHGADKYRRGLYTFWKRTATYPAFVLLDATSREACTVRRITTNTPLQALGLLNDPMYFTAAKALGARMLGRPGGLDKQLAFGFRLCTAHRPNAAQIGVLEKLHSKLLARYEADSEAAKKAGGNPKMAAMTMVANVLLNMDETISKS